MHLFVSLLFLALPATTSRSGDLFETAAASVVKIRAYKGATVLHDSSGLVRDDFEYGTGFVLDKGLVVTAKHTVVVGDGKSRSVECWSRASGRYEGCAVVFLSPDRDIAVLWYPRPMSANLRVRASESVPRASLFVASFPDTPYSQPRLMLTEGNVVEWTASAPGATHLQERKNLALSDVLAFPGCSGAPVITRDMEVVGMVISVLQNDDGEWNGATYFVKSADITAAVVAARQVVAKKKGYEFLDPH